MADPDRIRSMIREISGAHGVALSPDDPILILETINAIQRMAEGAKMLVEEVAAEVSKGLGKPLEDGRTIANRNLIASALTIAAAIVVLLAVVTL